jgi:maltose alpha-D-glucosyltransferase/alpha-amylase
VDEGVVVDAMVVPHGALVVVAAALHGEARRGRTMVASGAPRAGVEAFAYDEGSVRILRGEQSNSSVILGGQVIGKLVRRLSPGESPDVTLPTHLRTSGFRNVPAVVGTLDGYDANGDVFNVVVVHDAVMNDGDLWQMALDILGREAGCDATEGPPVVEPVDLDAVVALLARRTAEMHLAMSARAPGFEAEPLTLEWQRSAWERLQRSVAETQRALDRDRSGLSPVGRTLADLCGRPDLVTARFGVLNERALGGATIRIHGDLHLGQVLWTGDDVVFIDFEGEPGRPIAERSVKQSPIADVAGMLRSLDYASRAAADASGQAPGVDDDDRRDRRCAQRTTELQGAFWSTYCRTVRKDPTASEPAALIPDADDDARLLLDLHLLMKALYEVRYELANRPSWAHWPIEAVVSLLSGDEG